MPLTISESLAGLPVFLAYFGLALAFFVLYCVLYVRITPYAEYRLIREGKIAPAISFSGAIIGFVIPLASAVSHSVSLLDMIAWGAIAFVVQILVFFVTQKIFSSLAHDMENDRIPSGIMLAVFSIAAGVLNAACMTY
jgi:putative membrane protein